MVLLVDIHWFDICTAVESRALATTYLSSKNKAEPIFVRTNAVCPTFLVEGRQNQERTAASETVVGEKRKEERRISTRAESQVKQRSDSSSINHLSNDSGIFSSGSHTTGIPPFICSTPTLSPVQRRPHSGASSLGKAAAGRHPPDPCPRTRPSPTPQPTIAPFCPFLQAFGVFALIAGPCDRPCLCPAPCAAAPVAGSRVASGSWDAVWG
ncbi:hypothetical protein BKA81DRAFT_349915 [Phyllosticta paracitricarpa]|uniref:Uncharacterized protein n=1 Tax=Phyllosticta paracitricarpa TaxID=2016321 RepID=A0ABR1N894_9PEZI